MTTGEAQVAQSLGPPSHDAGGLFRYWYEPVLRDLKHGSDRTPDFVLLDSGYGLFVLEVKDWMIDQIMRADLQSWNVRKGGITRSETPPIEQARVASQILRQLLESSDQFTNASGPYQGRAKISVEYGAVLPNITRAEAKARGLLDVVGPQYYFFKDDLAFSHTAMQGGFAAVIRQSVRPRFNIPPLSPEMLQAVDDLIAPQRHVSAIPDLRSEADTREIDRLNAEQQEYARSLGDGHRILTGCAGSGKTLVVAARARFLKQAHPSWRVRIICYNAELVPHIYRLLGDMHADAEPKINVQNFHAYAREYLGGNLQRQERETDADFAERTAAAFVASSMTAPPHGAYDTLLIDEGQDLRPEWTSALVRLVNPQTDSVFFCASRQQNIYGISSYKDMGIQAKGRTKHLRKSYRCSSEIITLAEAFKPDLLQKKKQESPGAPPDTGLFASSERGSRRIPQFIVCEGEGMLCRYICNEITRNVRSGQCAFRDIAILYTDRYLPSLEPLFTKLSQEFGPQHVFAKWRAAGRLLPDDDTVKMTTIHGSKGLEWRIIFVLGMERIPRPNIDAEREKSLAYVALTRAEDEIHFVSLREAGFHREFKELAQKLNP